MDIVYCSECGISEGKCFCGKGKVILTGDQRVKISKFLSGLLRHFPHKFGIELDKDGYASFNRVMEVIKARYGIDESHLKAIVTLDRKRRFEIRDGKIRARYGHSIYVDVRWSENGKIPDRLYHATSPENIKSILSMGLIPVKRREVHMTETADEAIEVGLRHSPTPVLLEIDAKTALRDGIEIRRKGVIFTADRIPAEYIRVIGWRKK